MTGQPYVDVNSQLPYSSSCSYDTSSENLPANPKPASNVGDIDTLIVKELLLISSTSSPASNPNARVLQTADKADRGLSFPSRAVSAVEYVEEVDDDDGDGRSNSSDITCEKGGAATSSLLRKYVSKNP